MSLARPSGLVLVAFAALTLCLSCSGSESTPTGSGGTGGSAAAGSGGATGAAGTTGAGGTTGLAGTTGNAGTSGGAGTNGNAGTSGGAGTSGNAGTTGNAGTSGNAGTNGNAGRGGATGAAGSAGGAGGSAAARGGNGGAGGGAAGRGGAGGGAAGRGGAGGGAGGGAAGRGGAGGGAAGRGGSGGNAGSGAGGTAGSGAGGTAGSGAGGTAGTGAGGAAMPTAGCGKPAGLTSGRASIDVNGKAREYILAVPSNYDQNKPYRLIFGWHPWGGSAQQTQQMGYFGIQTPSNGQAILVAPEGQDYQNNGLGWANANGEDVAFYHAMVDRFSAQLCVDQSRIFSTGFSFGAMFTFTLACTEASGLRAIAPQAGNTTTSGGCASSTRSVATMSFIGTDDSLLSGHRSAVQVFVGRNGCSGTKTTVTPSWCDGLQSSFLPCTCWQYPNCKTGYPVIECEYKAGHQFAPSSGTTLWNFFSQF